MTSTNNQVTDALLPCPFCGGERVWQCINVQLFVRCEKCSARGPRVGYNDDHAPNDEDWAKVNAAWNTRAMNRKTDIAQPTDDVVEQVSEAIYDFLHERFPDGAMPGGKQLFADDHLDAEFKHEAGCDEMARAIITTLQSQPNREVEVMELAFEQIAELVQPLTGQSEDRIWRPANEIWKLATDFNGARSAALQPKEPDNDCPTGVDLGPLRVTADRDVIRLVRAARAIAFGGLFDVCDADQRAAIKELDEASEAFANAIPWEGSTK